MNIVGINLSKLKYTVGIGVILLVCLISQSQKVHDYISTEQARIVDKPTSVADSSSSIVINPGWKIFKNSRFQFEYPSQYQIDDCSIQESSPFFCSIVEGEELVDIEYEPTKYYGLEEENNIEKSLLIRYTFDGETCHRRGEIYSTRNFVNLFGLESKELKVKAVVECHSPSGECNAETVNQYYSPSCDLN